MKRFMDSFKENKLNICVSLALGILMLVLLVPILRVGFHNYATGDDYWYGAYTYQGYKYGGIIGAISGSVKMLKEMYVSWQGTWFTMILFSLAPQNFNPHAYFVTVFVSVGGLFLAEYFILKRYLVTEYGFDIISFQSILFLVFFFSIEYMPRTTSGIFWFNGVMHYTIPLLLAFLTTCGARTYFSEIEGKRKAAAIFFILFGMFALGGSNYLAAIFGLMGIGYETLRYLIEGLQMEKKLRIKKCLLIVLAVIIAFAGLYISYKSPGNDIRSGDDMSFRPKYFLMCIWWSIDRAIVSAGQNFMANKMWFLFLVVICVITYFQVKKCCKEGKRLVKYPLLALLFVNGAHLASYLPEVYSHSDVSGGVPNTHQQMLLLVIVADAVILWDVFFAIAGKKSQRLTGTSEESVPAWKSCIPCILVLLFVVISAFSPVLTTGQMCRDYASSGRMAKYEEIWWEQWEILTDDSVKAVEIPEYYEDVYPVCHMTLSSKPEQEHNVIHAKYFEKEEVRAYNCLKEKK